MRFLSLCSGIEAASVAWHDLGFECVGVSEIEKFPSEVLKYHYPSVPNLGDMTKFKEWKDDLAFELLVGGTPCQSFSVAGLRKGMDDPRGNLALTYVAIAEKYKPQWFVWENVPGVLSSNEGKDFASFLTAMESIGYGICYRVLDAQFFGVPQRRRRVFVVGYFGDWRPAAAVLLEPSSVFGHTPKGRKARKGITAPTETSPRGNGEGLVSYAISGNMIGRQDNNGPNGSGINNELMFTVTSSDRHAVGQVDPNAHKVGSLCARDYKGIGSQDILSEKIVTEINPRGKGEGLVNAQFWNGSQIAEALTTTSNEQRMPDKGKMQMIVESNVQAIPYDLYQITAPINKQNREVGDPCHTLARDNAAHASIIEIKESNIYEHHPADSRVKPIDKCSTLTTRWDNVPLVREESIGVDIYNANLTHDLACTVTAHSGGSNTTGPKLLEITEPKITEPKITEPKITEPKITEPKITEPIGVDIYNADLTHDLACTVTAKSGGNDTTGPKLLEIKKSNVDPSFTVREELQWWQTFLPIHNGQISGDGATTTTTDIAGSTQSSKLLEPIHPTLTTTHGPRQGSSDEGVASLKAVFQNTMRVRRLTPVECERLQGFPDNWTQIPYGKKTKEQCPDGHRYKALGNSMAVPVMRWIGRRIKLFESLNIQPKQRP